jgi:hypothetical protein
LHFCECFLVRRDVSRGHVQVVGKEGGTGTHQCQFLELQNDQKEMASQLLPYIEQRSDIDSISSPHLADEQSPSPTLNREPKPMADRQSQK